MLLPSRENQQEPEPERTWSLWDWQWYYAENITFTVSSDALFSRQQSAAFPQYFSAEFSVIFCRFLAGPSSVESCTCFSIHENITFDIAIPPLMKILWLMSGIYHDVVYRLHTNRCAG